MYLLQHDGLLEQRKQESALSVMLPEMSQFLRACCKRSLCVKHAPVINRLQLSKITHEDHRDVAKFTLSWVLCVFAEVSPLALLNAPVHASEQGGSDEGYLINNQ